MSTQTLTKPQALLIRPMESHEIDAVANLAARIWRAHYVPDIVSAEQIEHMLSTICSAGAMQKALREKNQRFWLMEDKGELIGYAAIEPRPNGSWFIDKLYVNTARQRSGLGGAFMRHILKETNGSALSLRVNRKNFKAINFYFKHGFAIDRLLVTDVGKGFVMDDFMMKRGADA